MKEEPKLSKRNYTQYSNKNHNTANDSRVAANAATVTSAVKPMEETVETVALPKIVKGVVVNCTKLNVRENCIVDSDIVCVLDAMSEVEIDVDKSVDHWFYIYTAIGAEGYCMKQYVEARM